MLPELLGSSDSAVESPDRSFINSVSSRQPRTNSFSSSSPLSSTSSRAKIFSALLLPGQQKRSSGLNKWIWIKFMNFGVAFDWNAGDNAFISLMAGQLKKLADYIRHLCQLDGSCTLAVRSRSGGGQGSFINGIVG